jgi:hypothetical protein
LRGVRASRARALGVLLAVLAFTCMTAVAMAAGGTTLATGHASVKGKTKTLVVNSHGVTLYTLGGETNQVTLNAHPLYPFAPDGGRGSAAGKRIAAFGGTLRVVSP